MPSSTLEDAVLLRRQHENLARRRPYAMSQYKCDGDLVKENAAAIMKQHRKEFLNSEAQKVQSRYQFEQLGFGCGYDIYIYGGFSLPLGTSKHASFVSILG